MWGPEGKSELKAVIRILRDPVTSQGHLVIFKQGNGVTKFFSWWFLWGNVGSKYLFVEKGDKGGSWGCGLEQRF